MSNIDRREREQIMTTLRSRAQWYRDGCDGLEDREGYWRSGDLLRDVAFDLEAALEGREERSDPRCPRCGYTMCQLFDERPMSALATMATPNGQYQCYHCTPITRPAPQERDA